MRGLWVFGAAALLAGCVGTPLLSGTMGAPSFVTLQQMCGNLCQRPAKAHQVKLPVRFTTHDAPRLTRVTVS